MSGVDALLLMLGLAGIATQLTWVLRWAKEVDTSGSRYKNSSYLLAGVRMALPITIGSAVGFFGVVGEPLFGSLSIEAFLTMAAVSFGVSVFANLLLYMPYALWVVGLYHGDGDEHDR